MSETCVGEPGDGALMMRVEVGEVSRAPRAEARADFCPPRRVRAGTRSAAAISCGVAASAGAGGADGLLHEAHGFRAVHFALRVVFDRRRRRLWVER